MLFVKMFDPPSGNISLIKGAGVSLMALSAFIAVFVVFRILKRRKQQASAEKRPKTEI